MSSKRKVSMINDSGVVILIKKDSNGGFLVEDSGI
jgi:hypothetical protein